MKYKGGALQTYQRIYCPEAYPKFKSSIFTEFFNNVVQVLFRGRLILCLAGFLIGRAVLLGELAPFALPYWAVVFSISPYKSLFVALSIVAGSLTYSLGWYPLRLGLSILLFTLAYHHVKRSKYNIPGWVLIIVAMAFSFLPQLVLNYFLLYDIILLSFEVVLALLAWSVFLQVVPLVKEGFPGEGISFEEVISLMLTSVVLIVGIGEVGMGGLISLQGTVSKFIILTFGFLGGGGIGAAAGAVLGFVTTINLGEQFMPFIGIFALAGLLAGVFRELGKIGSAAGYLVGSMLLSFYLYDLSLLTPLFIEDILIAAVFLLIPLNIFNNLSIIHSKIKDKKESSAKNTLDSEKYKNLTVNRVRDLAGVFEEVAATINQEEEDLSGEEDEIPQLVNKTATVLCSSCNSYERCWRKNLSKTKKSIGELIVLMDNHGKVPHQQVPKHINRNCSRKKELISTINNLWSQQQAENLWEQKVRDSRNMVTSQLEGISQLIKELSREIKIEDEDREKMSGRANLYTTELGVAQMARAEEEVTGDSFGFYDLKGGRQAVIISDGMGWGESARKESQSAVNLMEKLLKACKNKDVVVNMANSLLQVKKGEAYATVDLLLLDLKEGEGEFVKIGACPTHIKRGDNIKEIKGSSLPIGIVSTVEPSTFKEKLHQDDHIIMITDGFTELRGGKVKDTWFKEILREVKHAHPQIMADYLLDQAYQLSNGQVKDDFTVVVCKIVQLKNKINSWV